MFAAWLSLALSNLSPVLAVPQFLHLPLGQHPTRRKMHQGGTEQCLIWIIYTCLFDFFPGDAALSNQLTNNCVT